MAILCMLLLILAIFLHGLQSNNQHSLHTQEAGEITVKYTVMNDLSCNFSYNYSLCLSVSSGTTLLQIMECAQDRKPEFFGFTKNKTSLGYYITSIGDVNGSAKNRTYWQFLNGTVPIPVGVQQYKPSNGEHVIASFSRY